MLIFTNRELQDRGDASAFLTSFTPAATTVRVAHVKSTSAGWSVEQIDKDVSEDAAHRLLLPLFGGDRPVLVYLHGNNNTPAQCIERCRRLESLYDVEVIGFSWPAEGYLSDGSSLPGVPAQLPPHDSGMGEVKRDNRRDKDIQSRIRRYHQAKTNAQDSVDALAGFLRVVAAARLRANRQPFSLAAHSLGAHLLQYTTEVDGANESLGTAHNIVLLAPCVRSAGHQNWVKRLRPRERTYIAFNKGDSVLFGAFVADGQQLKLGTDPGRSLLQAPGFRYISFSNTNASFGGHRYFVDNLSASDKKLFQRILRSAADIQPGEDPRDIYPIGCEQDGAICFMAVPDPEFHQAGGGN